MKKVRLNRKLVFCGNESIFPPLAIFTQPQMNNRSIAAESKINKPPITNVMILQSLCEYAKTSEKNRITLVRNDALQLVFWSMVNPRLPNDGPACIYALNILFFVISEGTVTFLLRSHIFTILLKLISRAFSLTFLSSEMELSLFSNDHNIRHSSQTFFYSLTSSYISPDRWGLPLEMVWRCLLVMRTICQSVNSPPLAFLHHTQGLQRDVIATCLHALTLLQLKIPIPSLVLLTSFGEDSQEIVDKFAGRPVLGTLLSGSTEEYDGGELPDPQRDKDIAEMKKTPGTYSLFTAMEQALDFVRKESGKGPRKVRYPVRLRESVLGIRCQCECMELMQQVLQIPETKEGREASLPLQNNCIYLLNLDPSHDPKCIGGFVPLAAAFLHGMMEIITARTAADPAMQKFSSWGPREPASSEARAVFRLINFIVLLLAVGVDIGRLRLYFKRKSEEENELKGKQKEAFAVKGKRNGKVKQTQKNNGRKNQDQEEIRKQDVNSNGISKREKVRKKKKKQGNKVEDANVCEEDSKSNGSNGKTAVQDAKNKCNRISSENPLPSEILSSNPFNRNFCEDPCIGKGRTPFCLVDEMYKVFEFFLKITSDTPLLEASLHMAAYPKEHPALFCRYVLYIFGTLFAGTYAGSSSNSSSSSLSTSSPSSSFFHLNPSASRFKFSPTVSHTLSRLVVKLRLLRDTPGHLLQKNASSAFGLIYGELPAGTSSSSSAADFAYPIPEVDFDRNGIGINGDSHGCV